MNALDAEHFVDNELITRWPDYDFSPAELSDWKYFLQPFDHAVAIRALREHAANQEFDKKPNLSAFRKIARLSQPAQTQDAPEPTVFVMFMGESEKPHCRLQAGYFFPIIVPEGQNELHAAERLKEKMVEIHGGEWRVYSPNTCAGMVRMRNEMRGYAKASERKESA